MAATTPLIPRPARRPLTARAVAAALWENFWALMVLFFVLFPIAWMLFTSFRVQRDIYSTHILTPLTLDNFQAIFQSPYNAGPAFWTSLLVASGTVLIGIPLGVAAAYVFARFRFFGSQALLVGVLVTQFIPPLIVAIPFFNLFRTLHLIDTPWALIIVYLSIVLPYSIWMLRGFIDSLPIEIEEAAVVDGCNDVQVLQHVTFPLILPGVITTLVFSFIMCWNEFTYALILAGNSTRTIQIALMSTNGVVGVLWEKMSAIGMLVMVPMLLLSFTIRKYFVEGLTMGAVK